MTEMPHFFISYRRSDREGQILAHLIFRELRRLYGEESAFLDVDSRSPGLSFPVKVDRALNVTDVVLVIIGPAWLQHLTERLGDSRDWVRYEVAESLKRSWLPVVPVCLAGVEMPRPHQLPEELKDLGWRDGVTLDPCQDFDSHLARLLSDLEHVLKSTRREKEELRLARWKLTALLRWRAHQLDLAAAREVAAARLVAERAAKERAAAEEREAKRAAAEEEAALAAQEAARVKAAAARAAAQEAPVVPSRRVSPPAPSGALATTPAAKYYQLSGRFTIARFILSLLGSGLVIFALAFAYSYSLLSLPFVQANVVLTLLYGLLSGLATGFPLRWITVRNSGMAALIGLAAGLGAVYLSWAVWVYGPPDLFKAPGLLGLVDLVFSPARLWHFLRIINATGSWDIWGYKPTGTILWLLWSLEAALIIGLSSFFAAVPVVIEICEACGTWCQSQPGVAKLRSCGPAELKRRLEAKDLAFLEALGAPPSGANQWLALDLNCCEKCGTTNTLDAYVTSVTSESRGRRSKKLALLVSGLLVTAAECAEIQRIGREAAKGSPRLS
ncbi:MAG TPA: toll/interleukin-1 receptor domain-containing protein [Thermoanaerobaculia bacterium]|nr:toll/interleukin-1 receptor domain-containing protein [Thermoanaerobaculia bacterium]